MKTRPSTGPDLSDFLPHFNLIFMCLFQEPVCTLNPLLHFPQLMFLDPFPLPKDDAFLRQSPRNSASVPLSPVDPVRKTAVLVPSLCLYRGLRSDLSVFQRKSRFLIRSVFTFQYLKKTKQKHRILETRAGFQVEVL